MNRQTSESLRQQVETLEPGETLIALPREVALAMLDKLDACHAEQDRIDACLDDDKAREVIRGLRSYIEKLESSSCPGTMAELRTKLDAANARVAQCERRMADNACVDAINECFRLADGTPNWDYPGQLVHLVKELLRQREQLSELQKERAEVLRITQKASGVALGCPIDGVNAAHRALVCAQAELQQRKGVRFPHHKPSAQCVEVWTWWRNDCEKPRYQWILRNKVSLVEGEYWRTCSDEAPEGWKAGI